MSEEVPDPVIPSNNCSFDFSGKDKTASCSISLKDLFKKIKENDLTIIGDLDGLVCETPLESECNAFKLIKSNNPPLVAAAGIRREGKKVFAKYVMIISSDKKTTKRKNLVEDFKKEKEFLLKESDAAELHRQFHGTEPQKILGLNIKETDWMVFFGHLNFIVYKVPNYSERRGTPFIHTARDKGDNIPKSKTKPMVCVSPERDYLVMYGAEFEFGSRGIIG
mgnify:CR=1 FL=1